MDSLNLPTFEFSRKIDNNREKIFDIIRKRWVILTPEEWVRQHFVRFLIAYFQYPAGRIANEVEICMNGMSRRCDSVVYSDTGSPLMIIEFKAPQIPVTQKTFDQIAVYNIKMGVRFLIVSNGLSHTILEIDKQKGAPLFLEKIPTYGQINQ